jgi:hypothetical protein
VSSFTAVPIRPSITLNVPADNRSGRFAFDRACAGDKPWPPAEKQSQILRRLVMAFGVIPRQDARASVAGYRRTARLVFVAFLLTFVAARVLVFLIMARMIPDLFLRLGGTHVHHLNYGIFLLSGVGAWLLFSHPAGRARSVAAVLYAVGLALTFDEFGMWLHLGGGYWQRASFDAVTVVAALLGLLAYAPEWRAMRPRQWWTGGLVFAATAVFFVLLFRSLHHAEERVRPRLERLEREGPR